MAHTQFMDELVKEYLTFRGLTNTLKAFENELKIDKDKGFRVDKVLDNLLQNVYTYNIQALRSSWSHLENRLFSKLPHHFFGPLKKLENAVLKFYLVHATENDKADKVNEFFVKLTPELVGNPEWKDWFALPYVKNPEDNPIFAVYFTKQWQDSFQLSLHNILAASYQNLPQPVLSSYEEQTVKLATLQRENELLKKGLVNLLPGDPSNEPKIDFTLDTMDDVIEDFFYLAQEVKKEEAHSRSLKTFMKSIGSVSPVNKSPKSPVGSTSKKLSSSVKCNTKISTTPKKIVPSQSHTNSFLFLSQDQCKGHTCGIISVKFNNRGNLLASLDVTGNIHVWTVPSGFQNATFLVDDPKGFIDWSANHERYLLWAGQSGHLKLLDCRKEPLIIWSLSLDQRLIFIKCHPIEPMAVIGIRSKALMSLDLKTRQVDVLKGAPSDVTCVSFDGSGQLLVGGQGNGQIFLYNLETHEIIGNISDSSVGILSIQVATDKDICFCLYNDKQFFWRSLAALANVKTFDTNKVFTGDQLCVDSSGTFILAVGSDEDTHGVVYKVNDDGLKKCLELGKHKGKISALDWCFANQCATCVTAAEDGSILISTLLNDNSVL